MKILTERELDSLQHFGWTFEDDKITHPEEGSVSGKMMDSIILNLETEYCKHLALLEIEKEKEYLKTLNYSDINVSEIVNFLNNPTLFDKDKELEYTNERVHLDFTHGKAEIKSVYDDQYLRIEIFYDDDHFMDDSLAITISRNGLSVSFGERYEGGDIEYYAEEFITQIFKKHTFKSKESIAEEIKLKYNELKDYISNNTYTSFDIEHIEKIVSELKKINQ